MASVSANKQQQQQQQQQQQHRVKKATVAPPVPRPAATPTCGNCSEYVLQLLALSSEKCVRDDELEVLRTAQQECSLMASDIHRLYACIEEQRQHIVKLSAPSSSSSSSSPPVADPGMGIFALLDELSRRQSTENATVASYYHARDARRDADASALMHQVGQLSAEVAHARCQEAAAVTQCNEVSRCLVALRAELAETSSTNARNESLITLLHETNGVSRREIEAQYRCIAEQQRHFNAYASGETPGTPDEHVGLYALVSDVKQNEFEFYLAKLARLRTQMHASTSLEVQKAHAILSRHLEFRYAEAIRSSWGEYVASQQACAALKVQLDAVTADHAALKVQLDTVTADHAALKVHVSTVLAEQQAVRAEQEAVSAELEALKTCVKAELDEQQGVRFRKLSLVYRVICARKDRELADLGESVDSLTRLLTNTFQKLKDAKLCVTEREFTCGKLALMNTDALKSRDAIQIKLHDALVERQRALADKRLVEVVLQVEREEHAKTTAAFKLVRTRLCAIVVDAGGDVIKK